MYKFHSFWCFWTTIFGLEWEDPFNFWILLWETYFNINPASHNPPTLFRLINLNTHWDDSTETFEKDRPKSVLMWCQKDNHQVVNIRSMYTAQISAYLSCCQNFPLSSFLRYFVQQGDFIEIFIKKCLLFPFFYLTYFH